MDIKEILKLTNLDAEGVEILADTLKFLRKEWNGLSLEDKAEYSVNGLVEFVFDDNEAAWEDLPEDFNDIAADGGDLGSKIVDYVTQDTDWEAVDRYLDTFEADPFDLDWEENGDIAKDDGRDSKDALNDLEAEFKKDGKSLNETSVLPPRPTKRNSVAKQDCTPENYNDWPMEMLNAFIGSEERKEAAEAGNKYIAEYREANKKTEEELNNLEMQIRDLQKELEEKKKQYQEGSLRLANDASLKCDELAHDALVKFLNRTIGYVEPKEVTAAQSSDDWQNTNWDIDDKSAGTVDYDLKAAKIGQEIDDRKNLQAAVRRLEKDFD